MFKYEIDNQEILIGGNSKYKILYSKEYNYIFRKNDGFFLRFGKIRLSDLLDLMSSVEKDDINYISKLKFPDASYEITMPEILDIEISTICSGVPTIVNNPTPCQFCYKRNTKNGENMSFETFKKIFDKLPKSITQIAFGIGDLDGNPDLRQIFQYTLDNEVIPNLTINGYGLNPKNIETLKLTGAVAVSNYNKDITYNAIKTLTDLGKTQINIHNMICEETYDKTMELFNDSLTDKRLEKLNAIVLLSLKKKGRAVEGFNNLSFEKFKKTVLFALDNQISIGFDSCTAFKFQKALIGTQYEGQFDNCIESCESSLYSTYIDVQGNYFPCSFSEGSKNWIEGISVLDCNDFLKDVWRNPKTLEFKRNLLELKKEKIGCPIYDI